MSDRGRSSEVGDRSDGVEVRGLAVVLGAKRVVDGVDVSVPPGTTTAIVGPSGAGKSTLLRAIAGLVPVAAGEIALGGRTVARPGAEVDPAHRGVGLLFQGYALWPHLSAADHLRFVLECAKTPKDEIPGRVAETLDGLGLGALTRRLPDALSGGERQRLALARAVVARPRALLLDEPTASLDPATARDARALTAEVGRRFGCATLVVTHDQDEALAVGDTVVVLDQGRVRQAGTPEELYRSPRDAFVAAFVGEGTLVSATVAADGRVAATPFGPVQVRGGAPGAVGRVLLRPENAALVVGAGGVEARVRSSAFRGASWRHVVRCGDAEASVDARFRIAADDVVRVALTGECAFLTDAEA